jgi:hypothetical protein
MNYEALPTSHVVFKSQKYSEYKYKICKDIFLMSNLFQMCYTVTCTIRNYG